MGRAEGPAHFLEAQRLFENDGTPYFVSLARGTKLFFNILRKYGTHLPYNCSLHVHTTESLHVHVSDNQTSLQ